MAIKSDTIDAPAHWASYLINGDASGFDFSNTPDDPGAGDREQAACDAWHESLGPWYVVSTEDDSEAFFGRWDGVGTDLLTYVIHRKA